MGICKVILNGVTRMDVTDDNPVAKSVEWWTQVTGADGEKISGVLVPTFTLLRMADFTLSSTTSTSAASATSYNLGADAFTSNQIIYVKIRDKAGPRNGYFAGSDTFFFNPAPANGATTTLTSAMRIAHSYTSSGDRYSYPTSGTTGYGLYGYSISSAGSCELYKRYSSTYSKTLGGSTYRIWIYAMNYVDEAGNPYAFSAIS